MKTKKILLAFFILLVGNALAGDISILDLSQLDGLNISINITNLEEKVCLQNGPCNITILNVDNVSVEDILNVSQIYADNGDITTLIGNSLNYNTINELGIVDNGDDFAITPDGGTHANQLFVDVSGGTINLDQSLSTTDEVTHSGGINTPKINEDADSNLALFGNPSSGETNTLCIGGFKVGDIGRNFCMQIDDTQNDAFAMGGVSTLNLQSMDVETTGKGTFASLEPTLIVSDSGTPNTALTIEENSGGEQYEIGLNSNGELEFYNSGSSQPTLALMDTVTSKAVEINNGNINIRQITEGGWINGMCWEDNDGTIEICIWGNNNDDIILGKSYTDRDRWEFDGPTGKVRMYGTQPSIEQHAERTGGGVGVSTFDQYFKQTGETDTNIFQMGTIGTVSAPTSTVLFAYMDVDNGDPNGNYPLYKWGLNGISINNTKYRIAPSYLLEMYQMQDNNGMHLCDEGDNWCSDYYINTQGDLTITNDNNLVNITSNLNVQGNLTVQGNINITGCICYNAGGGGYTCLGTCT